MYLRRAVHRRVSPKIRVQLVDVDNPKVKSESWGGGEKFPVVTIDGEIFSVGTLSFRRIIEELMKRRKRR